MPAGLRGLREKDSEEAVLFWPIPGLMTRKPSWVGRRALWVKALATKPDNLSSVITVTHRVEENHSQVVL